MTGENSHLTRAVMARTEINRQIPGSLAESEWILGDGLERQDCRVSVWSGGAERVGARERTQGAQHTVPVLGKEDACRWRYP